MNTSEHREIKAATRRVWTLQQRDGLVMRFEVTLTNHRKLEHAADTIRRVKREHPELRISEHDE